MGTYNLFEAIWTMAWVENVLVNLLLFIGCLPFLTVCLPTAPIEFLGLVYFGWRILPGILLAPLFSIIFIHPLVLSSDCSLVKYLLHKIYGIIDSNEFLQFFKSEVEEYPLKTALLVRFVTIPFSIQNYFLMLTGCKKRDAILSYLVVSVPLLTCHFYIMDLLYRIVENNEGENYLILVLKLLTSCGTLFVPSYFVRKYMTRKR